jgi:hypothetical protein
MRGVAEAFNRLCEAMSPAKAGTLQEAEAEVQGHHDLLPRKPEEVELDKLSEEELQKMSQLVMSYAACDEHTCIEKLQNMRNIRDDLPKGGDEQKAIRAINTLRARIMLLRRQQKGSSWRAHTVRLHQPHSNCWPAGSTHPYLSTCRSSKCNRRGSSSSIRHKRPCCPAAVCNRENPPVLISSDISRYGHTCHWHSGLLSSAQTCKTQVMQYI